METFDHVTRLGLVTCCTVSSKITQYKVSQNLDSKWAPLSVVIVAGVPKRATMHPLKKASATVFALTSTNAMASGTCVKRLTHVNKYLGPAEYGEGPTRWTCRWSYLSVGSLNFPKTGLIWRETLAVWQPVQDLHQFAISIFIPCHTKRVFIRGFVALWDGCPKPWSLQSLIGTQVFIIDYRIAVNSWYRRSWQCVGCKICFSFQVSNIGRELCDIGQMPSLAKIRALCHWVHYINQRLMISIDEKFTSFQVVAEMSDRGVNCQKLSIKSTMMCLCWW